MLAHPLSFPPLAGTVGVVAATSSLKAAINLRARRVIFKHAWHTRDVPANRLDATSYMWGAWRCSCVARVH